MSSEAKKTLHPSLDITIGSEQLDRIFPFHFIVGPNLNFITCGPSLKKLISFRGEAHLSSVFKVVSPFFPDELSFEQLASFSGKLFLMQSVQDPGLKLRGQLEWMEHDNVIVFLCSPSLNSFDEVRERKLNLADFAVHDQLVDMLHLLRQNKEQAGHTRELMLQINEQKNILETDRQELKRLSLVASANKKGIIFINGQGQINWSNEGFLKMTGFSMEEVLGITPIDRCIGPKSDGATLKRIRNSFWTGASFDEEVIHYRKDGSWFWGRVIGQPIFNDKGQVEEYFSIIEDISEKKAVEAQIRILSSVVEKNINPIIILDAKGKVSWCNQAFTDQTGYLLEEALNRMPHKLLAGPETNRKSVYELISRMAEQLPVLAEMVIYNKAGYAYWAKISGQPLFNEKSEFNGYFLVKENISNEKKAQEQIRQADSRIRKILEQIGDNVWVQDFETNHINFSKPFNSLLEKALKPEEVAAEWYSHIYEEDKPLLVAITQKIRSGEMERFYIEYRLQLENGKTKWVLERGIVTEKDYYGRPLKMVGTHTDITLIKKTETELKRRISQFQSLSENIPGVIFEYEFRTDGSEGYRYISPSMKKIFGIEPEAFFDYNRFVHPDDQDEIAVQMMKVRTATEPFYNESRVILPDGSIRWRAISASFSYVDDKGSKVFVGFMSDITDRKIADEMIRSNEEKYRTIIKNMKLGLMEVDLDEKIRFVNQTFCDMCGYTPDELYGMKASTLFLKDDDIVRMEMKNEARRSGLTDAYEITIYRKNGESRWWLISGAPQFNDRGELIGTIGIHLDITDQKKIEQELIFARESAEESSKVKEHFLANMSHEIRTPLNAILGMSGQLSKTLLNQRQQFFLDIINTSADNLLVIINDILDLSKISAGKLQLESIGYDAKEVVNRVLRVVSHKAQEKGLQLERVLPEKELEPVLIGDPYRLNQVLLNLMTNAIKFTEKGKVSLGLYVHRTSDREQELCFSVSDTGIGMEQHFIDKLFDQYTQAYDSVSRKYGGTGLGMSITRELVTLMGGTISVVSQVGSGTTIDVNIRFPIGTAADLPVIEETAYNADFLDGKQILVVDDNEMNRLLATTILQQFGAAVDEVESGEDAIKAVRQKSYDLVLMDIQMPEMNGHEATAVIRKEQGNQLPILALTANAIKGEREKCLASGMNDFIAKPFKEEAFLQTIAKWLEVEMEQLTVAPEPEPVVKTAPVSLEMVDQFSRGKQELVQKMIRLFIGQIPVSVEEIGQAATANDWVRMRAMAHKIKPVLDTYKMDEAARVVRVIEKWEEAQTQTASLFDLVSVLKHEVKGAVVYLETILDGQEPQ